MNTLKQLNILLEGPWINEYWSDRSGSVAGVEGVQYGTMRTRCPWDNWTMRVGRGRITFTPRDDERGRWREFTWTLRR